MVSMGVILTALVPLFVTLAIFVPVLMAMKLIYTSLNQDLINDRKSYEELLNSVADSWLGEYREEPDDDDDEEDEYKFRPGEDVFV